MYLPEKQALLEITYLAATVDGRCKQDELSNVLSAPAIAAAAQTQAVATRSASTGEWLTARARQLTEQYRQLAFDSALVVCNANGLRSQAETIFLTQLGMALDRTLVQMAEPAAVADALVTLAFLPPPVEADLDTLALTTAIQVAALETLASPLSWLAADRLQRQLVFKVATALGQPLTAANIDAFFTRLGLTPIDLYLRRLVNFLDLNAVQEAAREALLPSKLGQHGFALTLALAQASQHQDAWVAADNSPPAALTKLIKKFGVELRQAQSLYVSYVDQIKQQAQQVNLRSLLLWIKTQ